jgi:fructokinase
MKSGRHKIVGLGEVLWDLLPDGKHLGGAPANFAHISNLLGDEGIVASRVGNDTLGRQAVHQLELLGLASDSIQRDPNLPTGTVNVEFQNDQPQFEIAGPVAWDFLEWTPAWRKLAAETDAVCFGTLAQRSPRSRETIRQFLSCTPAYALRVFDVNLRQSFYSVPTLLQSMQLAHIVKLNEGELPKVLQLLGLGPGADDPGSDLASSARRLVSGFGLTMVCVTRGAHGSVLVTDRSSSEHPGFPVRVVDAVGAGDAFTAGLVHHYLRGAALESINDAANRLGAWVASNAGATPMPQPAGLDRALAAVGTP